MNFNLTRGPHGRRLAALALGILLTALPARADVTENYHFSGVLSGPDLVTGTFTIDFTTSNIAAFDFASPIGTVDSAHFFSSLTTFTAVNPSGQPFIDLAFFDSFQDNLVLIFQTTLGSFQTNPSTALYTNPVDITPTTVTQAIVSCGPLGGPCPPVNSLFSSGAASLVVPPTGAPEPGSLAILGTALAGLGFARRRRGQRTFWTFALT